MSSHDHAYSSGARFLERNLSRRDLLRRAILGAAVIPTGVALLAACGDEDGDEVRGLGAETDELDEGITDDDDSENAGDPRRGGVLRLAMAGTGDGFDPHHSVGFESTWSTALIYNRLMRMTHEMEVEPDLALSWEPSEDGLTWTFVIREGAKFHNGRECVAQDVVRSFERLIDPDEGVPVRSQYAMIEGIEAVSDYEVAMYLSTVYADLPGLMTGSRALVFDADVEESLTLEPVGTGPYKLQTYRPGERIVLERNDDYFDLENQAFVDEIHFIAIPEETSRVAALTGGTIDILPEVATGVLPSVENAPDIEVDEIVTGKYQPIVMDASSEPFNDNRVRQAMKLCAQRQEILQAVIQGHGETATDHPVVSIDPMWVDIGIPEQDIERAGELLAEAGYPGGMDLVLHTSSGRPGMQEVALSIQEMAAPAGFRIEVQNHPIDAYWAEVWMRRPFTISNWSAYPVADMALSVAYMSDSTWNEGYWENEDFDELVLLGRETLDEEERLEIYREIQGLMAAEGPSVIAYFASLVGAWSTNVKGYALHPLQYLELNYVWLEEED